MSAELRPVDDIFKALSDPTRRRVLELLVHRPASATELAAPFAMALPSFVQHLNVLEKSGLVDSEKKGRVRTYRLVPERMKIAENWLTQQRSLWETRLNQLDAYLLELKEKEV